MDRKPERALTQSHEDTKKNGREDYQTNLLNQYEAINSTDGENAIKTVYQYDEDGNLIRDDKWNYEWNAENRLIAMETLEEITTQRLEFRYDPQGLWRIQKDVFKSETNNGKKTHKWKLTKQHHYIYDGWNLIAELDKNGNLLRSHLWGIDLSGSLQGAGGVGGLLKTTNHQDKSEAKPMLDGNGNIVTYIKAQNDNESTKFVYDPFGNTIKSDATLKDGFPFQFSTKYTDTETGLIYYGFRYYNLEMGRWISRDPIHESGGVNLFVFLNNDKNNDFDYLGFSGSGNATKIFGLAFATVFPMYRASLSVCWKKQRTCEAGCGLVSSYTATLVSGTYATCMAANALNPLGWVACKAGFAKALTLTRKMDEACNEACKSEKCCESGSGVDFGDPSEFVIEITL